MPGVNGSANSTTAFHRLFSDVDGATNVGSIDTTTVNTDDNAGAGGFRAAFNNAANYKSWFDFNGDGVINTADNLQFRNRFNRPLTWSV